MEIGGAGVHDFAASKIVCHICAEYSVKNGINVIAFCEGSVEEWKVI